MNKSLQLQIFTPIDKLIDQENGFEDINMEVSKKCAERQRKAVAQAIGPERLPETDVSYCETFGLIVEKAVSEPTKKSLKLFD